MGATFCLVSPKYRAKRAILIARFAVYFGNTKQNHMIQRYSQNHMIQRYQSEASDVCENRGKLKLTHKMKHEFVTQDTEKLKRK